jgi:hypothetical protein
MLGTLLNILEEPGLLALLVLRELLVQADLLEPQGPLDLRGLLDLLVRVDPQALRALQELQDLALLDSRIMLRY